LRAAEPAEVYRT